jgi:hypothetical protein
VGSLGKCRNRRCLTLSIHLLPCQGGPLPSNLSSRPPRRAVGPELTRISDIAVPSKTTYAAFSESRMKFANATKLDRKSGVA